MVCILAYLYLQSLETRRYRISLTGNADYTPFADLRTIRGIFRNRRWRQRPEELLLYAQFRLNPSIAPADDFPDKCQVGFLTKEIVTASNHQFLLYRRFKTIVGLFRNAVFMRGIYVCPGRADIIVIKYRLIAFGESSSPALLK